jgi:putative transposase
MKEIAETRVRYGYRRIHVLLRREGWDVNVKRIYRLYKEMGLQLRHKPPKRRVKAKLKEGRCAASCSNEVWAMDFVHGQLATGPKLRILTVVDTFSRFSPAVAPWFSFRAPDVVEVLERVCSEVGYPASTRVDQGSEFISRDLGLWAEQPQAPAMSSIAGRLRRDIPVVSRWTSAALESRPTTRSSSSSTADSGRSA